MATSRDVWRKLGGVPETPEQSFSHHGMQAILLTSSLLIVVAMLASLAWLASMRVPAEPDVLSVDAADELA